MRKLLAMTILASGCAGERASDGMHAVPNGIEWITWSAEPFELHVDPGSWPDAVAIGDVTGDGRADLVVSTTYYFDPANDYHLFVYAQQPDGTLAAPVAFPHGQQASRNGIALVDLDGSGVLDVVVGHTWGLAIFLSSAGSLAPAALVRDDTSASMGIPGDAKALAVADVDGDAILDMMSVGFSRGATIFFGDGAGGIRSYEKFATHANGGTNDLRFGDFDGNGRPDLAVVSSQTYENVTVHMSTGTALTPVAQALSWGWPVLNSATGIAAGDVTGDGRDDLLAGSLYLFQQGSNGSLAAPVAVPVVSPGQPRHLFDLDADGDLDLVETYGNSFQVFLNRPSGFAPNAARFMLPSNAFFATEGTAVGDLDSDGCADLAGVWNDGVLTLRGDCTPQLDSDDDGLADASDTCPFLSGQFPDSDLDGAGDACDNCVHWPNASQADTDLDGLGDACDSLNDMPGPGDPETPTPTPVRSPTPTATPVPTTTPETSPTPAPSAAPSPLPSSSPFPTPLADPPPPATSGGGSCSVAPGTRAPATSFLVLLLLVVASRFFSTARDRSTTGAV